MDPKDEVSNNPLPADESVITPQFVPVDTGEQELRRMPAQTGAPVPWWTWMVPGARRAYQMRNLQAGTAEVMQLVRSIHQNLEQQVETQRLLVSSLSALPEAVEGLRNIGRATEAQREMMGALQRQMTANAGTMDRFNDTLLSMDGTTKSIAERAKSSESALFDLLRRAQRRMAVLTVLLIITIAGVAGLAGYLLTGGKLPNLRLAESAPAAVTPPTVTPPVAPTPPEASAPETPAPVVPAAETPATETPAPATPTPEAPQPESPAPEATTPEVPAVETPAPETAKPDVPKPDVAVPETPTPEAPQPEAAVPEAPTPEAPAPETPKPESPTPEAATPEAATPEAPASAEAAAVNPEPVPAPAPAQPTEASLRLEKLLKELRERGSGAPPEAPQSPPLKP